MRGGENGGDHRVANTPLAMRGPRKLVRATGTSVTNGFLGARAICGSATQRAILGDNSITWRAQQSAAWGQRHPVG